MPPTRKTSLEKKLANATVTPDEIYKYLTIDKGLSHEHAMGMLPNIVEESEFIYDRIQNDAKYDPDHSKGRQGIGLFQYTEPTRRKNFVEAVPDWQTNWKGQIDFALSEPETKRYLDQSFDTLEDASRYFTTDWERPRNKYRQAEKRLDYVPGLMDQIEAQNTKPYASETFQSYVMPPVNVIEKDPMKEYIDLNSDDIINDLALAGQQMNYFAQGGGKSKKNYATSLSEIPVKSVKSIPTKELRPAPNLTQRSVPSVGLLPNYAVTDPKRILFDPNYTPPSEPKTFYDRLVDKGQSNSQLENLYEFFDVTGISSYDDAAAAYDQWNSSGRTYPTVEEGVDMFGAVPALGKLGNIRYLSGSNIHKGFELGKNLIYKNIPWQEIINKADALQDSYEDYSQDYDTKLKFAQGGARNANNMKRYYAAGGVRPELAKTILGNEGFVGEVYSDLGGTPTIGYGFTKDALTGKDGIPSWKEYWNADGTSTGKTMSREEADRLLEKIIKPYSDQVNNSLSSEIIDTLSQEQYDSLVDLTYRNGIGNMKDSGVFKAINDGNLSEASKIIVDSPDLNKIGGKQVNPGDAGYKGIKARNLRASAPFSNLDSGVDPTVDNMAAELGMPTSDVYNNLLVERGEFQRRSDIEQLKELDSEKVYDQTIDDIEGMLNNLFMNDNYQVRGEDAPSTFNTGVKERMDWLSQKVPNIERVIQPYGGEGERFKVDRKAIKDDIYTILDELGQITDEDSPLSYKSRIYKDPYEYQQPDPGIPESDFISPRFYEYYDRTKKDEDRGIPESDFVDPRFLPQEPIDPELPVSDSYAGPAISMEDADRLYNENINRKTPFNPNFLDDDYYAPRQRKEPTDIDPYINEDLSNMESGVFERENQRRKQAVSNDPSSPDFVGPPEAPITRMAQPSGNYNNPDIDYRKYTTVPESPADPVNRNMLSKLKGQDYMGLLSDIGGYAARMAPLSRAMREASSYDEERYPRFAPILPTATLPKRDVRDAFATAQQTALQQGKLDLGALSALATQQAKETARVEENVANERVGLLNQAQQLNNQVAMQEMADTAANKGAAATMKYQALAAMSQMGQGSLREANMRRNDQIVKQMFASVFDELDDIKGSIG